MKEPPTGKAILIWIGATVAVLQGHLPGERGALL